MKDKIDYITCIFIKEGILAPIASPLPAVQYHTVSSAKEYIRTLQSQGLKQFLIFGVPIQKDIKHACSKEGIVAQFLKAAKNEFGNSIILIADVGLSPYSKDGHSTVINSNGIDEKESYHRASQLAVAFAQAGADVVAPCLSLKEQVKHIKKALLSNGLEQIKVLAYSAKFSSSLYGPYRATIKSVLKSEDKKFYQTDYSNAAEALEQIQIDQKQGADTLMVKPGGFYLDILYQARFLTKLPLAVYHVSGEYAMIKTAAALNLINEAEAFDEIHTAFQRCGADLVIGYAPEHFVRWKNQKN